MFLLLLVLLVLLPLFIFTLIARAPAIAVMIVRSCEIMHQVAWWSHVAEHTCSVKPMPDVTSEAA
jgi:hypothetical protein